MVLVVNKCKKRAPKICKCNLIVFSICFDLWQDANTSPEAETATKENAADKVSDSKALESAAEPTASDAKAVQKEGDAAASPPAAADDVANKKAVGDAAAASAPTLDAGK